METILTIAFIGFLGIPLIGMALLVYALQPGTRHAKVTAEQK